MKWEGSVKDEGIEFLDIIPDVSRLYEAFSLASFYSIRHH